MKCGQRARIRRFRLSCARDDALWAEQGDAAFDFITCEECGGYLAAHKGWGYPQLPPMFGVTFPAPTPEEIAEWREFIAKHGGWFPIGGECPQCNGCLDPSDDYLWRALEQVDGNLVENMLDHYILDALRTLNDEPIDREKWMRCRHCDARVLRPTKGNRKRLPKPPDPMWRGSLLHETIAAEITQLAVATFESLKARLRAAHPSDALPDKQLRAAIERAIKEGLIKVDLGADGKARYRFVHPASSGESTTSAERETPANKTTSSS